MKQFRELTLEREHELPWFPRYRLTVHADGKVDWEGRAGVAHAGQAQWQISPESIQALRHALERARFTEFSHRDHRFGDDPPMPTITLILDDGEVLRANALVIWGAVPEAPSIQKRFNALADTIDEVTGTAPYVRADNPTDQRPMSFTALTLERGPCFGPCPIYAVNVLSDGRVDWIGRRYVDAKGDHSWEIAVDAVEKLRQALLKARFNDFEDRYENLGITDQSSATITVQFANGKTKRVYHYHGHWVESPEENEIVGRLERLQKRIDSLLGTKAYIGKKTF
jgi:hypothetical protein